MCMDYTYTPVEKYKPKIYNVTNGTNVVLCCYKIFDTTERPFLQYLLSDINGTLDFPRYTVSFNPFRVSLLENVDPTQEGFDSTKSLDQNVMRGAYGGVAPVVYELSSRKIFTIVRKFLLQTTKIEHHNMVYTGYKKYNGDIYLFIDLSISSKIKNLCDSQFCLIDEMVNIKRVYNKPIDPRVTNFVQNNMASFTILDDKNNKALEIPTAVYLGCNESNLNFTYIFGNKKSHDNTMLGPYYYFTNFENASKYYGSVRFAIFTGHMLVKQNFPNDEIDESLLKQQRLNDQRLNHKYELMTQRITDYDGRWEANYDSVYLGHMELDDGQILKNTPVIVVKSHDQQMPLDYYVCGTPIIPP